MNQETEFEKRRGVSDVEVRGGYAQVHVSQLGSPLMATRLTVLESVGAATISIDFLKLTPSGLSFLALVDRSADIERVLHDLGVRFSVRKDRSIVLVHGVNIRDEEGLIARIVESAISSGVKVEHISDMHDRVLIVVESGEAEQLNAFLRDRLLATREAVTA